MKKRTASVISILAILVGLVNLGVSPVMAESNLPTTQASSTTAAIETSEAIGISYHTHVQNIGWETQWAKNGESAGTEGYGYRLEGIEIELTGDVPDGAAIEYRTHVQNVGWENFWAINGSTAGTQGQGLRLEGIQIQLIDLPGYSVEYRTHVQNLGWESKWAKNGEIAGTQGQGLRLEGIQIRLVKDAVSVVTDLTGTAEVSSTGGVVSLSDGAAVTVPSGALSQTSSFHFSRLSEGSGGESFYQLNGVPDVWQGNFEVTLPLNTLPANTGDTYVAVYHNSSFQPSSDSGGTNRQLIKAEVVNGQAKILLPVMNTDIVTTLGDEGTIETAIPNYVLLFYVMPDVRTETVGGFNLTVPVSVAKANPQLIAEIKTALTETAAFIKSETGVNLPYTGGRNPLPVDIFDFNCLIERYLGGRSATAWGYLEVSGYTRASQLSNAWISINSGKFKDADAARQIRATVAHELFHYYEQLYLPTDGRNQSLLQEASAVWMEFEMMKNYPNFWPSVLDPENVGWFGKYGLLRVSKTACHNQDAHAYATALYLKYMSEKNGTQAMGKLWQAVKTDDELFKALSAGFNDINWYNNWPDFVKKLFSGDLTKAMPDTTWSIHTNAVIDSGKSYKVDDPYTQMKYRFSSEVYALSAQTHMIFLRYNTKGFAPSEKASLKITNGNSADVTVYLFKKKDNGDAELLATIDSDTPYVLGDLPSEGIQTLSLITATKWQPTAAGMNETRTAIIDAEIIFGSDTSAYDALVASLPTNNDSQTYTRNSWEMYQVYLAGCNLKLTSADSQTAIDAEVIKLKEALSKLQKGATAPDDYDCGWQPDYANLIKEDLDSSLGNYGYYHYDSAGRKHGLYLLYYDPEMTKPKYAWAYYENKIHGIATAWYENGTIGERIEYQYGMQHGLTKTWWENGNRLYEGNFDNEARIGTHTYWYENGYKREETVYLNDLKNGSYAYWYENGTLQESGTYSNDQKTGVWTQWHDNGVKKAEGNYSNNQKTGTWTYWYSDGSLSRSENY
ncbi:Clostridial hydrophobic W [anaerobic digester metagenome]